MSRYPSLVKIELKNLYNREDSIKEMIKPILAEIWFATKPQKSSVNTYRIDLSNSAGHQLQTTLPDYKAEYFEVWLRSDEGVGEDELWNLDRAYFTLLKKNIDTEDYDEFLSLHCEAGFLATRTKGIAIGNYDEVYEKQKNQEKYQRLIHLHLKFLNQYAIEKDCPVHSFLSVNNCLSKSHIAVTLGRDKFEFDSLDSMSEAMKQAIKMISDEILDELAENQL